MQEKTHRQLPRCVFLTGFMGAGKSTVGPLVAGRLGWRFIDLDDEIVRQAGRSVAQIFDSEGEAHFRKLESEALERVIAGLHGGGPAVIALGGGALTHSLTRAHNLWLLAQTAAPTVFLEAPVDELLARCRAGAINRPLSRHENQFRQLFSLRRPVYMEADVHVHTQGRSPEQIADEIVWQLAEWRPQRR
jgi:shikimate kinase